jgi:hypothetical protein
MIRDRRLQRMSTNAAGAGNAGATAPGRSMRTSRLSRRANADGVAPGADTAVDRAAGSQGAPLPAGVRTQFESSLGADLSAVRVHTGADSADAASAVGARAYATGQDIHFADGQYTPEGGAGLHLLAHEVAHTVQQAGGAGAPQYKLEVSAPGDASELEADRAADAMLAGAPAIVTSASGLARKEGEGAPAEAKKEGGEKGPLVVGKGFTLSATKEWPATKLGYIEITPSLSGAIAFEPAGAEEKGNPAEVSTTVDKGKDGPSVKIEAEKKLGNGAWGFTPSLKPEIKLDKKGPHFSLGLSLEHEAFDLHGVGLGPFAIEPKLFEWSPGEKELKVAFVEMSQGLSIKAGQFLGYTVTPSLTISASFEPNWEKIGEMLLERVGIEVLASAGLIVGGLATVVACVVGWAKAGHEFDEVSDQITGLHTKCQMAADEVLSGEHKALVVGPLGDLNGDTTTLANSIRSQIATKLGVPEAAIAAAGKHKPSLKNDLYLAAWKQTWPGLKAQLLEHYQDTTWTSYQFERNWLDTFETGDYAKGY